MSTQQRIKSYIKKETTIGLIINALFSLLFVWLIFGSQAEVNMTGDKGLVIDSIPQGLAIGLLGSFFPSFLTRKRLAAGVISGVSKERVSSPLPKAPFVRALVFAFVTALISLATFTLLSLVPELSPLSFTQALVLKVVWGGCLGAVVSYIALGLAIRDYSSVSSNTHAMA